MCACLLPLFLLFLLWFLCSMFVLFVLWGVCVTNPKRTAYVCKSAFCFREGENTSETITPNKEYTNHMRDDS